MCTIHRICLNYINMGNNIVSAGTCRLRTGRFCINVIGIITANRTVGRPVKRDMQSTIQQNTFPEVTLLQMWLGA